MDTPYRTIEHKGMTVEIHQDPSPSNPRQEFDNLGTMICCHNRYDMGDKHEYNHNAYSSWDGFLAAVAKKEGSLVSLPIYMYDHSGQTINTTGFSCPWDSGRLGFIYVTKEKLRKQYGWKVITKKREEQALKYLLGEVETYDDYLTGNVYGYRVKDALGVEIHSCWGFYGDPDNSGIIDEAKGEAECAVEHKPEGVVA